MKALHSFTFVRLFGVLFFSCAGILTRSDAASPAFVGEWGNKDANTDGNTRVHIRSDGANLLVHMWGRCHPTECDLGETVATSGADPNSLSVTWRESHAITTQRLTLLPDGDLEVSGRTRFIDRSGRPDYGSKATFAKGLVHDWSDGAKKRPRIPPIPIPPPAPGPVVVKPPPPPPAPAKIVVIGAIMEKWMAMGGGPIGRLGQPVANEKPTFDNVGRSQQFQKGIVSWHPETGAHVVWGKIGEHWLRLGREKTFGYPITDELLTPNKRGFYNHFKMLHLPGKPECSIYYSEKTGARGVQGDIRQRWAQLGWEAGKLGFPKSDEHEVKLSYGTYRRVDFEKGRIDWSARTGAKETLTHILSEPKGVPVTE